MFQSMSRAASATAWTCWSSRSQVPPADHRAWRCGRVQRSSPPTRGCSAAREAFVPALAGATRQLVATTSRRSGVHSVPTKIRAIRGPAAYSLAAWWPFPLVRGDARRVPPADEESACPTVVLVPQGSLLLACMALPREGCPARPRHATAHKSCSALRPASWHHSADSDSDVHYRPPPPGSGTTPSSSDVSSLGLCRHLCGGIGHAALTSSRWSTQKPPLKIKKRCAN